MGPLAAFRRLEPRRRAVVLAIGAATLAVAGALAGYGVLVVTTLNQAGVSAAVPGAVWRGQLAWPTANDAGAQLQDPA